MNWHEHLIRSRRERRRHKVLNVVVYDRTQTGVRRRAATAKRPPGWLARMNPISLTFWWTVGGRMFRVLGRADIVVSAASWAEAWTRVEAAIARRAPDARIGSLQVWGHGSDGAMWLADDSLDWSNTDPRVDVPASLRAVRDRFDPIGGLIWFRGCNTFRGPLGHTFAKNAAATFGVPAAGHAFFLWLYHSGTYVLRPGDEPTWSETLGYGPDGKPNPWSSRRAPNTVTMLRFHPPAHFLVADSDRLDPKRIAPRPD